MGLVFERWNPFSKVWLMVLGEFLVQELIDTLLNPKVLCQSHYLSSFNIFYYSFLKTWKNQSSFNKKYLCFKIKSTYTSSILNNYSYLYKNFRTFTSIFLVLFYHFLYSLFNTINFFLILFLFFFSRYKSLIPIHFGNFTKS